MILLLFLIDIITSFDENNISYKSRYVKTLRIGIYVENLRQRL